MELADIWKWYAEERLGPSVTVISLRPVPPWEVVELMFGWHDVFGPHSGGMQAVSYNTAFDEEADEALCTLARFDSFDRWSSLSGGAWRVLRERVIFAETVAMTHVVANTRELVHLPRGLDKQSQERALGLMLLLGPARTIDHATLKPAPAGTLPLFPASTPLRRQ